MTRPEDIPERVRAEAEEAYQQAIFMTTSDTPQAMVAMVARAILAAENRMWEECVADARQAWLDGIPVAEIWLAIRARGAVRAAAIRKGGEHA